MQFVIVLINEHDDDDDADEILPYRSVSQCFDLRYIILTNLLCCASLLDALQQGKRQFCSSSLRVVCIDELNTWLGVVGQV